MLFKEDDISLNAFLIIILEECMNSVSSHLKCSRIYACYVMLTIPNDIIFFLGNVFYLMCCVVKRSLVFWISDS